MTHPKLRDNCGDGIALFMLLEELHQNMKEHIETLTIMAGLPVSFVCFYIDALVLAVSYSLYTCSCSSRSVVFMELSNSLLSHFTYRQSKVA